MIAADKVQLVENLLRENRFSQRRISKMVGISRAVVGQIAAGTRPDYEARRMDRHEELYTPLGPCERCPGCGARVYLPCRLCRIRALKAVDQVKRQERVSRGPSARPRTRAGLRAGRRPRGDPGLRRAGDCIPGAPAFFFCAGESASAITLPR